MQLFKEILKPTKAMDNKQEMQYCNVYNKLFNRIEHKLRQTYTEVGTWYYTFSKLTWLLLEVLFEGVDVCLLALLLSSSCSSSESSKKSSSMMSADWALSRRAENVISRQFYFFTSLSHVIKTRTLECSSLYSHVKGSDGD